MKIVTIDWDPAAERFVAEGTHRGHRIDINAPRTRPEGAGREGPSGFSASELLLAGAGACAAWDVIEILRKQHEDVRDLNVVVEGEQHDDPPWAYQRIAGALRGRGPRPGRGARQACHRARRRPLLLGHLDPARRGDGDHRTSTIAEAAPDEREPAHLTA